MSRATEELLAKLHKLMADEFVDRLQNGEKDKDGNEIPATAATLNTIRQFLKDNGITAEPKPGSPLDHLNRLANFDGDADPRFRLT
ncbi:hypothetical protein RQ831_16160 [Roseomonas gilardii]|uniref:Uncharacterized protein n=1 Tax=Roseomonas gilardii TaxID=257708 RepID=A0A1L7AIC8_9PROT|nr:hypothetical protein [Roseomonas gilardii]APT58548.1 hypothetical protein RGI145_16965 [Roseomonas gilardii]MDT8332592.1 hypothetical protein [Roseomonas gilardii]